MLSAFFFILQNVLYVMYVFNTPVYRNGLRYLAKLAKLATAVTAVKAGSNVSNSLTDSLTHGLVEDLMN